MDKKLIDKTLVYLKKSLIENGLSVDGFALFGVSTQRKYGTLLNVKKLLTKNSFESKLI